MPWNAIASMLNNSANIHYNNKINTQNLAFQQQANQQNFDFQREMTQTNFDNQVKMWDMANAYNHPAEQMARYREAGLNPNLMYNQSNTATTPSVQTAQSASAKAPVLNPYYRNPVVVSNVVSEFINVLSQLEDLHMKRRQNDIERAAFDDLLIKYKLDNDKTRELIHNLKVNSGKTSAESTNWLIKNMLDSFDVSQLSIQRQMNAYRLAMMANDYDMIPFYNKILQNDAKISDLDVSNAQFYKKYVRWYDWQNQVNQYNLGKQSLSHLKAQTQKVINDDKWYWRLSHDISGALDSVMGLYFGSKIPSLKRHSKYANINNATTTNGGRFNYSLSK